MEAEPKVYLEGGSERGHCGGAGKRVGIGGRGGTALRGGEGEGEKLGAAGRGELAEVAGRVAGGVSGWKPGDAAGPEGVAFEAGVNHGAMESVGSIGGLDAGEGVVGAGEEEGAGLEVGEADVGDLVRERKEVSVGEEGCEGFGEDERLGTAEDAQVRAVGEVGGLDAVVIDEQDGADAEQSEQACSLGAEGAATDNGDGEGLDGVAGVSCAFEPAVVHRLGGWRGHGL
jgi:hypothetical protein